MQQLGQVLRIDELSHASLMTLNHIDDQSIHQHDASNGLSTFRLNDPFIVCDNSDVRQSSLSLYLIRRKRAKQSISRDQTKTWTSIHYLAFI